MEKSGAWQKICCKFTIDVILSDDFFISKSSIRHKAAFAGTAYRFCMQIAVIGYGQATHGGYVAAYAVGRLIAGNGAVLVCNANIEPANRRKNENSAD